MLLHHRQPQTSPLSHHIIHAPAAPEDVGQGAAEVRARERVEAQDVRERLKDPVLGEGGEVLDERDGLADGVGVCVKFVCGVCVGGWMGGKMVARQGAYCIVFESLYLPPHIHPQITHTRTGQHPRGMQLPQVAKAQGQAAAKRGGHAGGVGGQEELFTGQVGIVDGVHREAVPDRVKEVVAEEREAWCFFGGGFGGN